jgi:magnesium chelatase subunit I
MQEGDVQIKGYPVRLPLDVAIVFSANPEDYTARGKIVTPLKDRIGSEIRTHYPGEHRGRHRHHRAGGVDGAHKRRQAAAGKGGIEIPHYVRQIVEQIAFTAREDKKVDKRSASRSGCRSLRWSWWSRTPSGGR